MNKQDEDFEDTDLLEIQEKMFANGKNGYSEYLLTKLKLNPETLTVGEIETLRKIEYLLKWHDEIA